MGGGVALYSNLDQLLIKNIILKQKVEKFQLKKNLH